MARKTVIPTTQKPLTGLTIAYTRASEHWQQFHAHINSLGASAIHIPLLATERLNVTSKNKQTLLQSDYLIFTSANAVKHFFAQGLTIQSVQTAVSIGKKTTQALQKALPPSVVYSEIITAPSPYDSEALLSIFSPRHKKIVIIAASHGRKLLFEQLSQYNTVSFVYTYKRHCQPIAPQLIEQTSQAQVMMIASCSTLDCLMENHPQNALKLIQYKTCIAGISAKVAYYAQDLGFKHTIYALQASEEALIDAISHWWSTHKESEL